MAIFSEPMDKTDTVTVKRYKNQKASGAGNAQLTLEQAAAIGNYDLSPTGMMATLADDAARISYLNAFLGLPGVVGDKKKIANDMDAIVKDRSDLAIYGDALRTLQGEVQAAVTKAGESTIKMSSELQFDPSGPKSVLEMVYDIAEIASTKYDYNMRGDDFKFTMAMVHYSFNALAESTVGSMFDLTNRVDTALGNILGADKYRRLEELRQSINQREFTGTAREHLFKRLAWPN